MVKKKSNKKSKKKISKKINKSQKKSSKKTTKSSKKMKKKSTTRRTKPSKNPYISDENAFDLLKKARISTPNQIFCKKEKDLEQIEKKIGYPCVLKVSGKAISSRMEVKGIKKASDYNHATKFFKDLKKTKGVDKIIIQEHVEGAELIVTSSVNKDFGYVISIGIGGNYGKIANGVSFRIAPIEKDEVRKMLSELKAWAVIKSSTRVNIEKLSEEIMKISRYAIKNKINQIKIDPLICNKDNCFAVDAKIIL
jgi:acetate---CoA ligase (ADP-forming)